MSRVRPVLSLVVVAFVLGVMLPSAASAAATAPDASPEDPTITGATTATLNGFVDANGASTTVHFAYAPASDDWCTSNGTSGSPTTTSNQIVGSTFSDAVAADVTGLTAGNDYCFAVFAHNSAGDAPLAQQTFTAGAPTASTGDVTITGATTASLSGSVNPGGQSTSYHVDYALSSSDFCMDSDSSQPHSSTTNQTLPQQDTDQHDVSVALSSLTAGSEYCAQLVATIGTIKSEGGFTDFTAGVPAAQLEDISSTNGTDATITGSVNPSGQSDTTYHAEYAQQGSDFCNGDVTGTHSSTTAQPLSAADTTFHQVTVNLTGLTAGTDYCATLVAHNSSGDGRDGPLDFTQGLPFADTFNAVSTGASTATVTGSVNPTGQTTTYKAVYDTAASAFCTSGGTSGTPQSTTPVTLPFTDTDDHDESVDISGLTAGTAYCAEIQAHNNSGTAHGGTLQFTAGAPVADTFSGISTGASTATVSGSVNPSGQSTQYHVDYDVSTSSFCTSSGTAAHSAPASPPTVSPTDSTPHNESVDLTGLTAGTTYCAELVAHNASGDSRGGRVSFTVGRPGVDLSDVVSTGATSADVHGSVNPGGVATDYHADYDVATSDWCQSGGTSGSPAHSTTAQNVTPTDTESHAVTVSLSSLTSGTEYCVELVAHNSAATVKSGQDTFTAGAPVVDATDAHATGATTGVITGTVNPAGQTGTTFRADFATVGSAFCNSGGNSGTPTQTTPAPLSASDNTDHTESVTLTGLTAGTSYCALIEATNGSGTSKSFTLQFVAGTPTVTLDSPNSTGPTSEDLNGTVNPSGQATTDHFEYGDVTGTWCSSGGTSGSPTTTGDGSAGSGSTDVPATASVSGLTEGHGYCYRLVAHNNAGTSRTEFDTFTAGGGGGTGPGVGTSAASGVTSTGATLHGTVNPEGESTSYEFEYGPAGSSFCTDSGAPTATTATHTLPFTDTSSHAVSAPVGGLSPSTSYCYRLVAHNVDGDVNGPKVTFTTAASSSGGNTGGNGTGDTGNGGGGNGANTAASLHKAGSAKLTLTGKTFTLTTGITGSCPSNAGGSCSESGQVSVTLPKGKTASASKKKKKAKPVVIAKIHGKIGAGKTVKIKVKLTSKGAKLLRKYKHLKATITVTVKTPAGKKTTIKRKVTLKLPKAKKKH